MDKYSFVEPFAGVGGFRAGLGRTGWKCLWANEKDRYACQIYRKNFGGKELVESDIQTVDANTIPEHTLLTAGFPCQSFSMAGKRKGFKDTRGTLFYHITRIAEAKHPKLLLLENVKGLLNHDEGVTFQIIIESLEKLGYFVEWQVLNSKYFGVPQNRERVFIVGHLGKPSSKTLFPIGSKVTKNLQPLKKNERTRPRISTTVHTKSERETGTYVIHNVYGGFGEKQPRISKDVSPTIRTPKGGGHIPMVVKDQKILSQVGHGQEYKVHEKTSTCLRGMARQNNVPMVIADRTRTKAGKGRNLESPKKITNALSHVTKDNLLILNHYPRTTDPKVGGHGPLLSKDYCFAVDSTPHNVIQKGNSKAKSPKVFLDIAERKPDKLGRMMPLHRLIAGCIRRLTPLECERLQGFPDGWTRGISETQRYKVLGNAVTVNVIEFLGGELKKVIG